MPILRVAAPTYRQSALDALRGVAAQRPLLTTAGLLLLWTLLIRLPFFARHP